MVALVVLALFATVVWGGNRVVALAELTVLLWSASGSRPWPTGRVSMLEAELELRWSLLFGF